MRRSSPSLVVPTCLVCLAGLVLTASPALALTYSGGSNQFAGGFSPLDAPYGGFGGGSCGASKTPVVFVHGNGDEAKNWDYPSATGVASAYDTFKAAGYNDCELVGINWLSSTARRPPASTSTSRTGPTTTWPAATRTASGTSGPRTTPARSS